MKVAVEHQFTGLTGTVSSYDSTKTLLTSLLTQVNGVGAENNYISTKSSQILNLPEVVVTGGPQYMPHVYKWSDNIYWVFTATCAGAAATRTMALFEFDASVTSLTYKGFITLQGTTVAGVKTIRSFRAFVYKHTTGTISTSGSSTTIAGSGTLFVTERIAVGARIGFGTTSSVAVQSWFEITAIASDTSLTINSAVNYPAGTSYVIEEIRLAIASTNATAVNGGIHLIKGLNYGTFTSGGINIPEATTVDNIRASYLLIDPVGVTHSATFTASATAPGIFTVANHGFNVGDLLYFSSTTTLPAPLAVNTGYYVISTGLTTNNFQVSTTITGGGITLTTIGTGVHSVHAGSNRVAATIAADDFVDFNDHPLYLVNGTSTVSLYASVSKYNMRASLTLAPIVGGASNGASISAFVLKTNAAIHLGTLSQLNCGRIFTVAHGAASGVKSLWFTTSSTNSRIYRVPLTSITSASTTWIADSMFEMPPGTTTTYSALAAFAQVDYSSTIDRLFITNSTNRFGIYVTQYNTSGLEFDKFIGSNLNRLKLTTTAGGASDGLFPTATLTIWTEDGWMFATPNTITTGQNWLYVFPFGADSYYVDTSNQYVITPKLSTPNATRLHHVYVDHMEYAGTFGLGFPVETYRIWYRTSGIDDNSGPWTIVPIGADISAASAGTHIQFKIAFDIMGEICVPTRIYSICCVYEDDSQDSHYLPSVSKSSTTNKIFAWQQTKLWGTNIPDLTIKLFDASTNLEIFNDTVTNSSYGTWEYSTNSGASWSSWDSTQDVVGNYIRYTATSFGYSGVTVRAILSQT